jgi:putative ABC transport system substrate-binding protein
LAGKRLGLLRDTLPKVTVFGLLVNPTNANAEPGAKDAQAAATALGRELRVLTASTERDLEKVLRCEGGLKCKPTNLLEVT